MQSDRARKEIQRGEVMGRRGKSPHASIRCSLLPQTRSQRLNQCCMQDATPVSQGLGPSPRLPHRDWVTRLVAVVAPNQRTATAMVRRRWGTTGAEKTEQQKRVCRILVTVAMADRSGGVPGRRQEVAMRQRGVTCRWREQQRVSVCQFARRSGFSQQSHAATPVRIDRWFV